MKKNILMVALLAVGAFAQTKPEFSLTLRSKQDTWKVGSRIEVEVRKTNISDHALMIGGGINPGGVYSYDVRRDGNPVTETEAVKSEREKQMKEPHRYEQGSLINATLPPHRTETNIIPVSAYRDMSQPGTYTIQLRQDGVKSNTVTVTVEP